MVSSQKTQMFNLVFKLKAKEGGSGQHAIFLSQTYPELFRAIDHHDQNVQNLSNRIWILHNPKFYDLVKLVDRANDFSCCRVEFVSMVPGKHLTNGFSYFKSGRFDGWFPTVYQSHFSCSQALCIGYYARSVRVQSNLAFIDFAKNLPIWIPIVTMGTKELVEGALHGRKNWKHTYSNEEFWKSCSHYFYFRPSDCIDPFPHTLLEAIQSRHQIISPMNLSRSFKDGVDDLLSCIEFKTRFNPLTESADLAEECQELSYGVWKPYLDELVQTKFKPSHRISLRDSSKTFQQWIEKNLR